MIVDNCPAHPKMESLEAIKLVFFAAQRYVCLATMRYGDNQEVKGQIQVPGGKKTFAM